jgi:hypothetical protein
VEAAAVDVVVDVEDADNAPVRVIGAHLVFIA